MKCKHCTVFDTGSNFTLMELNGLSEMDLFRRIVLFTDGFMGAGIIEA